MTIVDNATDTLPVLGTDASALKAALAKLKPAVVTRPSLSVLRGVRLDATPTGLRLTTSSLDLELSTEIPAVVEKAGATVAAFSTLEKFVGLAAPTKKQDPVAVRFAPGDKHDRAQMKLTAGKATIETDVLEPNEWPRSPEITGDFVPLDLEALGEVVSVAARDTARPVLNTVWTNGVEYVGTDSYRLYITHVGHGLAYDPILVPLEAADLLGKFGGVVGSQLSADRRSLRVEVEDLRVTTRLIDGDFPNWRALVKTGDSEIGFTRPEFELALKSVTKLAEAIGGQQGAVHIKGTDNGLLLMIPGAGGVARYEANGHADVEVAFNPNFLADMLAGLDETRLTAVDAMHPWSITQSDHVNSAIRIRTRLLMPVRT